MPSLRAPGSRRNVRNGRRLAATKEEKGETNSNHPFELGGQWASAVESNQSARARAEPVVVDNPKRCAGAWRESRRSQDGVWRERERSAPFFFAERRA